MNYRQTDPRDRLQSHFFFSFWVEKKEKLLRSNYARPLRLTSWIGIFGFEIFGHFFSLFSM